MKNLIVIPVFNEEAHLGALLQKLEAYRKQVLVVNDGSKDGSALIANRSEFELVDFPKNMGLSAVYRAAFAYADSKGFDGIVFMDGDGQHDPAYIDQFINQLDGHGLVCGSRFSNPEGVPDAKIASNFFAVKLIEFIAGCKLPDAACGFRAIRRNGGWPKLGGAFGFEVIYSILLQQLMKGVMPGFVSMPPTYPVRDEYYTRSEELEGLLHALLPFDREGLAKQLTEHVRQHEEFRLSVAGSFFEAIYKSGNYIFSTDLGAAKEYFQIVNQNPVS